MVIHVALRDVQDMDARRAHLERHVRLWREATYRLWQDGGPAFAPDEAEPEGG
jgi:hypothetical protein